MKVSISTKISKEEKEQIHALVNKGVFPSVSEFQRTAVHWFLKEIEDYKERKTQTLRKTDEKTAAAPEVETDEDELEDLQRFVDGLY